MNNSLLGVLQDPIFRPYLLSFPFRLTIKTSVHKPTSTSFYIIGLLIECRPVIVTNIIEKLLT